MVRFSLCLAVGLGLGLMAARGEEGLARLVDGPALQAAFAAAARRGIDHGEVEVSIDLAADGHVTGHRIIRADPPGLFDQAADEAVGGLHYGPGDGPVTDKRLVMRFQVPPASPGQSPP